MKPTPITGTPKTDTETNRIQSELGAMRLDDWNAAFHEMKRHAEKLEVELQEMKTDRDYLCDRISC